MTTRPHKIQLAALIIAIVTMTSGVFPRSGARFESSPLRSHGEDANALAASFGDEAMGRAPLSFEMNRGQADSDVSFVGRGGGFALLLKHNEAVFSLHGGGQAQASSTSVGGVAAASRTVRMRFEGANPTPHI